VVVAPLQLVMLRVQAKLVVQVVEPLETMQVMQVRLLERELLAKVLTVD
jgi:hypothetical protein